MKMAHLLICTLGLLSPLGASAAPIPTEAKAGGPQIVVQAQSINQMLDKLKAALARFVPAKEQRDFFRRELGGLDLKKLQGIDPARPFGFYASLDPGLLQLNFEKSVGVLMVPVTGEKEFIELLGLGEIPVEKKDGFYSIRLPDMPVDFAMRFHQGYAYIGVAGKDLEPKRLLDPADVISAKETAALVVRIRIDQVPQELKDRLFDLLPLDEIRDDLDGDGRAIFDKCVTLLRRWHRLAMNDGRAVVGRVDLDPRTGLFQFEVTVDGKPKTELARMIRNLAATKNDFLGLVGADSVVHVVARAPLVSEEVRESLGRLIDVGVGHAVIDGKSGRIPEEAAALLTQSLEMLGRTVKSGDADLAASLRGPNKEGQFTAVGAVRLKGTSETDKAIRAAVKIAPQPLQKALRFDVAKIDGFAVHELDFTDEAIDEVKKLFGKNPKLAVLVAPDAVYAAFGPDRMRLLKEALSVKGGPAPMLLLETNGKRLAQLIRSVADPKEAKQFLDVLSQFERLPALRLDVSGGDKLTVKYEHGLLHGIGLWMKPTEVQAAPKPAAK